MKLMVLYTKHAEDMLLERKIQRSLIELAIKQPDSSYIDDSGLAHLFKTIEEKVLRVVARRENNTYIIITMYYDRRMKK